MRRLHLRRKLGRRTGRIAPHRDLVQAGAGRVQPSGRGGGLVPLALQLGNPAGSPPRASSRAATWAEASLAAFSWAASSASWRAGRPPRRPGPEPRGVAFRCLGPVSRLGPAVAGEDVRAGSGIRLSSSSRARPATASPPPGRSAAAGPVRPAGPRPARRPAGHAQDVCPRARAVGQRLGQPGHQRRLLPRLLGRRPEAATAGDGQLQPLAGAAMVSARPSLFCFNRVSRSARGSESSSARPAASSPAASAAADTAGRHRLRRLFPSRAASYRRRSSSTVILSYSWVPNSLVSSSRRSSSQPQEPRELALRQQHHLGELLRLSPTISVIRSPASALFDDRLSQAPPPAVAGARAWPRW